MKRWISVLLTILVMVAPLALADAEEQVVLTFGFWGGSDDEIAFKTAAAELYMEAHPNVKIEYTYTAGGTDYMTKLSAWAAADAVPDVVGVASDVLSAYAEVIDLADIRPFMEADGLLDGAFSQSSLDALSHKGELLACPYIYKVMAIAYNKAMFDEAGIAYPTDNWTEAEFLDIARRLTSGEGRTKVYGFYANKFSEQLSRSLYGVPSYDVETGEVNIAGNEAYQAGVKLFIDMIQEGVFANRSTGDAIGGGFETGRFAMSLTAPWDMANFSNLITGFDWDICMFPTSEEYGPWMAQLYGDGWSITEACAHKDVAWDFIKFMCTTQEQQAAVIGSGVPMLLSYLSSDEYLDYFGENLHHYDKAVYMRMLERALPWRSTGIWAEVNDAVNFEFEKALYGEQDLETAFANMQAKAETVLAGESAK